MPPASTFKRTCIGLLLLGLSFGYVEAAVVVYLRALSEPIRQKFMPGGPNGELFPLIGWNRLQAEAPESARLVQIEVVREAATILMLTGGALLVTGSRGLWLPSFAVLFGMWDLSFYLFLKVLLNWPSSLFTWDLLFLIPVPWTAPILAPVLVSIALVGCGLAAIAREVRFRLPHWSGLFLGSAAILWSFMSDYMNVMGGAVPDQFSWGVFSTGMAAAVGAFLYAFLPAPAPGAERIERVH